MITKNNYKNRGSNRSPSYICYYFHLFRFWIAPLQYWFLNNCCIFFYLFMIFFIFISLLFSRIKFAVVVININFVVWFSLFRGFFLILYGCFFFLIVFLIILQIIYFHKFNNWELFSNSYLVSMCCHMKFYNFILYFYHSFPVSPLCRAAFKNSPRAQIFCSNFSGSIIVDWESRGRKWSCLFHVYEIKTAAIHRGSLKRETEALFIVEQNNSMIKMSKLILTNSRGMELYTKWWRTWNS